MMKKNKVYSLKSFLGLIVLISLCAGCAKPPDFTEIAPNWEVSISAPQGTFYVGDNLAFSANIVNGSDPMQYQWTVTAPDLSVATYLTKAISLTPTQTGTYSISLKVTRSCGAVKTANTQFNVSPVVNPNALTMVIAQKGGSYVSGDNLKFDSLTLDFKISSPNSLGSYTLTFGDGNYVNGNNTNSQVVIEHRYNTYGSFTAVFTNNDGSVRKSFTINKKSDTVTVHYDVDIDTFIDVIEATTCPDALFARVDPVHKKIYLLVSVTGTDRGTQVGPETVITLEGNFYGLQYTAWDKYQTGLGRTMVVSTRLGKYLLFQINDYKEGFLYRGNIRFQNCVDCDGIWANARNFAPYYGIDIPIGDTGTFRFVIRTGERKLHRP